MQKFSKSRDDIDNHFQIHALAQLHLAMILLPVLQQTADDVCVPSRIVFTTSDTHNDTSRSVKFASLDEINTDIGQTQLYFRAKLAQLLLTRELASRLEQRQPRLDQPKAERASSVSQAQPSVLVNAVHPGAYCRTPLVYQLKVALGLVGTLFLLLLAPFMPDPMTIGCRSGLFASTPNAELMNNRFQGQYIVPDKKIQQPGKMARDAEMGMRLWELCMKVLEAKLGKLDYKVDLSY